jgi:hypothetical protein
MSCEHLICASCAGPVAEGRCPVCRDARQHVHHSGHGPSLPVVLAAVLVALLLSLAAMHLAH